MAGTSTSFAANAVRSTAVELSRTTRCNSRRSLLSLAGISSSKSRGGSVSTITCDEHPRGPYCIYVGPIDTASKEILETLYSQKFLPFSHTAIATQKSFLHSPSPTPTAAQSTLLSIVIAIEPPSAKPSLSSSAIPTLFSLHEPDLRTCFEQTQVNFYINIPSIPCKKSASNWADTTMINEE
ncbi:hypothetical protein Ahy_Scaffold2g107639 [Arachis hypogaea]|uniref:Uncharacterized protein n=1 Tax=Arachis hypogaea TaxID=3818 RepID=A0A444WQI1_ARAHY|nr:hypothetical protein Ahy_Scaffold2g107639 [Arachis hypogaea]